LASLCLCSADGITLDEVKDRLYARSTATNTHL